MRTVLSDFIYSLISKHYSKVLNIYFLIQKEASAEPTEGNKKTKADEKRKRDKSITNLMKTLNYVQTSEEKLDVMYNKHVELAEENKKMQFYIKQSDKR